jgi:hypothetical protein
VNHLRNVLLLVLLTVLGCGQQLVEFPLSGRPTVSVTDPADGDTGVPLHPVLHAAFSKGMDPATLTTATFSLKQGGKLLPATVTYAGTTATLTPAGTLSFGALCTATITTGARDFEGLALAADYVWSFTTRAAPDTTPPTVSFTDPADQDVAVAVGAELHAGFSEAMDPATLTAATFTVAQGAMSVPGVVTYDGLAATFTPTSPLAANALVTATITTGARDPSGNALTAQHVWTFTTSALPDVTAPAVTFTDPVDQAKGVAASATIQVAFNETMDCATVNAASFTLAQGAVPVSGAVTCSGPTATFTPAGPLTGSPTFTATITTGAKDLNGNGLLQSYVWSFETGLPAGEAPVALGAASDYAILAFNTVTNISNPGTIVTGDLGISPGAALIGFPPGQVIGQIHAGDAAAAAAKASLLAAYDDAVSRLGAAVLPADLSGLTFSPGLYKNSTSVMLSAGNLTLDAQGNPNAVFVFQMGSTLTTNAGTQVVLSGGAKATNIFWAVGTSATLGTSSIFKGTILAASAITLKTGASIEGRLLAQGAAVALDTNAITKPAP